jgi:hypothetical protein
MQTSPSFLTEDQKPKPEAIPYSRQALRQDRDRLRDVWSQCQNSRRRDAIYEYLSAVYNLVTWWAAEGRDVERAYRALWSRRMEIFEGEDPFAAIIRCTADDAAALRIRANGAQNSNAFTATDVSLASKGSREGSYRIFSEHGGLRRPGCPVEPISRPCTPALRGIANGLPFRFFIRLWRYITYLARPAPDFDALESILEEWTRFHQGVLIALNVQLIDTDGKRLRSDRKGEIYRWRDASTSTRKLIEYVEPQPDQLALEPLTCGHAVGPPPAQLCRTRR